MARVMIKYNAGFCIPYSRSLLKLYYFWYYDPDALICDCKHVIWGDI